VVEELSARKQRIRSLTKTCQGSQHRLATSADNTITWVPQVCSVVREGFADCW
jgi:hypothetical protein